MDEHPCSYVPKDYELNINKPTSKFIFYTGSPHKTWLIEITVDGIKFNREFFPNVDPDGFAKAFIEILERNYTISFTKKD